MFTSVCPTPYYGPQYMTAVNKKQTKDTNHWQSPQPPSSSTSTQPSSLHHQLTTNPNHPHSKPDKMDDDGGWSQGSPAKGSGWSTKVKNNLTTRDHKGSQGSQGRDWGGSPEVDIVSTWTHSEHRNQASAGGSSGEGDSWNMFSPGQTNGSRHSQPDNWMSDDGSLSMGDNASSLQSNPSISPTNGGWGAPDGPQELEPIGDELDKELAQELDCPDVVGDGGVCGNVQFQIGTKEEDEEEEEEEREVGERGKATGEDASWEDLDTASLSSSDKDTLVVGNSSTGLLPDNQSDNGSKTTSRSPSADMDQSTDSPDSGRARDKDAQKMSGEDSGGQQSQSSSMLEGTEMNMWKSRTSVGSTSSINSVGSNSSWKSEGKGFHGSYHSKTGTFSPRKSNRYDSQSSSASSTSGGKTRKGKKPTVALDDALEMLHSEPSGWGELPSPKPSDVDNGTEIWGVAPDDMHRKNKSSNWMDSQPHSGEWEDDSGTLAAGWMGQQDSRAKGGRMATPGTPSSGQWGGPHDGWGIKKNKQNNFAENVSKLMDMGFSHQMAEKYLKTNGNDLDATIGDLLAVGVVNDDGSLERMMSGGNSGRTNKKLGRPLSGTHSFGAMPSTMPGVSTPTSTTPGTSPSLNKDLYYQQLMLNSLSALQQPQQPQQQQQQQQQQVPSSQMQAQLAQLQFLQMQQYLQLPTQSVLGYQQMLTQQMLQFKLAKQQITQQLLQLQMKTSQSGGMAGSQQQQQQQQMLQTRLNLINQFIHYIQQQLLLQKLPGQQKDKGGSISEGGKTVSSGMGSTQVGRNTPPSRNKDMKISGPVPSRSMSLPGGSSEHNLSLGMQSLSINGHPPPSSISQSSARSVSRLQQIISGSSSTDNLQGMEDKSTARFRLPPGQLSAATSESFGASNSPPAGTSSSSATTPASTPFSPARSFNDIQEFRPGVPWQPRALPTEPAQVYAKTLYHQASVPDMRSVQNEPSYSQLPGQPFPQGGGMRPLRRPPSLSTSYYNPSSTLPPGGFKARGAQGDKQQGWLSNSMPGPKGYHSSISSPMASSQFGGSSTPDNVFSPNAPPFGSRPKQHILPPRHGGNPPFSGGGDVGQPPARPQALFTGPQPFPPQPMAPPSSASDTGSRWGSVGFSSHPSTSITSSVWNSSSSKPWNEGPHPSPSVADPGPRFSSPPLQSNTSVSAGSSDRLAASLSSAWNKEGLQASQPKSLMLSPEPTFAEWQAGKKAHLSVFKLPSNPPSEWLLIKNVNSQVDEASLRDVCSEFGMVQSVTINPSTESAIVKYMTREDAMQAKSGLDKSPVICDVSVCVDFATSEDVSDFYSQPQLPGSIGSVPAQSTSQEKWFGGDKTNPPGTATLMNGSRWDGVNLGRRAQTEARSSETPSALWSNNAFLPGLSSPWANHCSPGSNAYPLGSAGEKPEEHPPMSSSPSLSTYLPNGLF